MESHGEDHTQSGMGAEFPDSRPVDGSRQDDYAVSELMPKGLSFRLIADFIVEADNAKAFLKEAELTAYQRRFFVTMLTVPVAFNEMCKLAIVSDFETNPGKYFEDEFVGPETADILNCALPYLLAEDREYWSRLRQESSHLLDHYLLPIFMEFRSSLQHVVVEDMTTGEAIPARISGRRRHR